MIRIIDSKGEDRAFDSFESAAAALEAEGQCPGELVRLFHGDTEGRAIEPVLWPSEADATSVCRREMILKRVRAAGTGDQIGQDMRRVWDRFTGIAIEQALQAAPASGHFYQFSIPDDLVEAGVVNPSNEALVRLENGDRYAVDLGPELGHALMRGRLDRVSEDLLHITDWKVTGYPGPGRDWGLKDGWVLQQQLYAFMLRRLLKVSPTSQSITIWRIYRDPYTWQAQGVGQRKRKIADMEAAFKRYSVPVWDDATLIEKLGDHLRSSSELLQRLSVAWGERVPLLDVRQALARYMEEVDEDAAPAEIRQAFEVAQKAVTSEEWLKDLLADVPMDGEHIFNGKKCAQYCDVREACFLLAGRPEF